MQSTCLTALLFRVRPVAALAPAAAAADLMPGFNVASGWNFLAAGLTTGRRAI